MSDYDFTLAYAQKKDDQDDLKKFRSQFCFPSYHEKEMIYFTGNSLGLQPVKTKEYIQQELNDWAKWGVEGHFHAKNPWYAYHELLTEKSAKIVGAKPIEIVVTHSLTTNLHLLMVSFYKPKGKRVKILCEGKAFPSDQYALASQVEFHGYRKEDTIVEMYPREGEHIVRDEDVVKKIEELGDELALVMIGGVNYYSGQLFDMKKITKAGHKVGSIVGFDLAHAAGNVELSLHEWGVDFAAWCTYKYMNSGPGGVSGMFVHEKHAHDKSIKRFAGWWGHNKDQRFKMDSEFDPIPGAEGWQLSNAPVISMAAHLASLELFDQAGMKNISKKRNDLTAYLAFVINHISKNSTSVNFEIITPLETEKRGAQLSILAHGQGEKFFDDLSNEGVVADWREPNVVRIAPAPLYNSYEDVYKFGKVLEKILQ